MNSPGLFYDDKLNRKIISSILSQSSDPAKEMTTSRANPQLDPKKENPWA